MLKQSERFESQLYAWFYTELHAAIRPQPLFPLAANAGASPFKWTQLRLSVLIQSTKLGLSNSFHAAPQPTCIPGIKRGG
jgi:hypothetical protein